MNVGNYRHYVSIQYVASRTKDAGGGFTDNWAAIGTDPNWWCSIEAATERAMQRVAGGGAAVISTATRIIEGRYHSGITTAMRLVEGSRVFKLTAVDNVQSEGEISRLLAEESVL